LQSLTQGDTYARIIPNAIPGTSQFEPKLRRTVVPITRADKPKRKGLDTLLSTYRTENSQPDDITPA